MCNVAEKDITVSLEGSIQYGGDDVLGRLIAIPEQSIKSHNRRSLRHSREVHDVCEL